MSYIIDFKDFAKFNRVEYIAPHKVEENFYKVQDLLGEPTEGDILAVITLRLKGKADWVIANSADTALELLTTKAFWGRKSRYKKLPYASAKECNARWDKNHLHSIIRITELKQSYSIEEVENIITGIALSLKEVNSNDKDAVKVRTFPFCKEQISNYGNSIEYICKTSSIHYDPTARKILTTKEKQQLTTTKL